MRYGIGTLRDNQRDMTGRDTTWHDVTWHDLTWHDVTWRGMTWRDVTGCDRTWHDMAWRGRTWHHVTWQDVRDMAWYDVIWRDMTWHDMTWQDVTWRDMTIQLTIKHWSFDRPASFARLIINLEHFCQGTNVWVTTKTSRTGIWPEFRGPSNMAAQWECQQWIPWPQKHK